MRHTPTIASTYLGPALTPAKVRRIVKACVYRLKPYKSEFDSIAFRGVSGALIAPLVALRLNKPLIVVRKAGEKNHSYMKVEGNLGTESYVIIDDLIASGQTIQDIMDAIANIQDEYDQAKGKCHSVLLYLQCYREDPRPYWRWQPQVLTLSEGCRF